MPSDQRAQPLDSAVAPAAPADPLAAFHVSPRVTALARWLLRMFGWRLEGGPHLPPRFVLIAAPHTTNWDAVVMLLAAYAFRIRMSWFLKHTWFRWPMGILLRALGGFPIDRRSAHNVVAQVVDRFRDREALIVTVPPEGTRRRTEYWKTGFYHIALGASVPIVFGYLDYARKVAGIGRAIFPSGDIEADFALFREFYDGVTPLYPELKGPVAAPPAS
jgi:1-acyl-sn-glycerol-3-phosphate acyltransferase